MKTLIYCECGKKHSCYNPHEHSQLAKQQKEFAYRVAKVMYRLKSSHVYFILQMAFGETLDWNDAEYILKGIIRNKKSELK